MKYAVHAVEEAAFVIEQLTALKNAHEFIDSLDYVDDTHEQILNSTLELITRAMKYTVRHSDLGDSK